MKSAATTDLAVIEKGVADICEWDMPWVEEMREWAE